MLAIVNDSWTPWAVDKHFEIGMSIYCLKLKSNLFYWIFYQVSEGKSPLHITVLQKTYNIRLKINEYISLPVDKHWNRNIYLFSRFHLINVFLNQLTDTGTLPGQSCPSTQKEDFEQHSPVAIKAVSVTQANRLSSITLSCWLRLLISGAGELSLRDPALT